MNKPSAVVDTNLFISALILPKSKPGQLITAWKRDLFALATSVPMLVELEEVLKRPKYEERYGITPTMRRTLIRGIKHRSIVVPKLTLPSIPIRDQKDAMVLATALDTRADYLVTGDNDLLVLSNKPQSRLLQIVTVNEFLKRLKSP